MIDPIIFKNSEIAKQITIPKGCRLYLTKLVLCHPHNFAIMPSLTIKISKNGKFIGEENLFMTIPQHQLNKDVAVLNYQYVNCENAEISLEVTVDSVNKLPDYEILFCYDIFNNVYIERQVEKLFGNSFPSEIIKEIYDQRVNVVGISTNENLESIKSSNLKNLYIVNGHLAIISEVYDDFIAHYNYKKSVLTKVSGGYSTDGFIYFYFE